MTTICWSFTIEFSLSIRPGKLAIRLTNDWWPINKTEGKNWKSQQKRWKDKQSDHESTGINWVAKDVALEGRRWLIEPKKDGVAGAKADG